MTGRWSYDKAKCGLCGWKAINSLNAEQRVRNHQNSKHGGRGAIYSYDKSANKWEDEL